jgi:hypothetical protein
VKSTKIKRVFLAFIASVFIATSLASIFPSPTTGAVSQPTQKGGGCLGDNASTGATSPFSSTPKLCLGQSGGQQYYQFAVDFGVDVTGVSVTGVSEDSGHIKISFIQENSRRYVSTSPANNNLGYQTSISNGSSQCNSKDGSKLIDITVKANGQTKKLLPVNLCGHTNINDSVIYSDAGIAAVKPDGSIAPPAAGTAGSINGNLGIYRTDQFVPAKWQQDTLEQDGVVSIKLSGGPSAKSGTNASSWFQLQGGLLVIPDVQPGIYKLDIVYNDKSKLQNLGGDPSWTSSSIPISFPPITVLPGGEAWVGGSSVDKVVFFNSTGTVVQIPKAASADKTTSCVIDGVGWIVCSLANFFASVTDGIYSLIQNLLKVPVINTNTADGTNGVYNTWSIMRNFANVGFVIGFLIIIFSQITSVGVSNYGVKKTLPRLIVAAILVNVSYWISAIAVDLSNILGSSLYNIISGVKDNMNIGISANWGNILGGLLGGTGLAVVGGVVVAGAATAVVAAGGGMAIVFLALPLVLSAVLAVLVAVLVLIGRQALVVILIIISPLAFVALLLPNTEKLFSRWRNALISLLLLYPIVSIVVGGAQIAGLAIMSTAKNTTDPASTGLAIVIGQTAMVIPFFLLPSLIMKFSGNNLTGIASTMMSKGKGLVGGISGASRKEGRSRMGRSLNTMKYGEKSPSGVIGRSVRRFGRGLDQIKDKQGNADKYLGHERQTTTLGRIAGDEAYATASAAGSVAGGKVLKLRAQASAQAEADKDAKDAYGQANLSSAQKLDLALKGSTTTATGTVLSGESMQRVAITDQLANGGYGDQEKIIGATQRGELGQQFHQTVSNGVIAGGVGAKDPALTGKRIDQLAQGNFNYEAAVKDAIKEGKYTSKAVAGMNDDARAKAIKIAQAEFDKNGDASYIQALQASAAGILASAETANTISGNATASAQVASLAAGYVPPPNPTP